MVSSNCRSHTAQVGGVVIGTSAIIRFIGFDRLNGLFQAFSSFCRNWARWAFIFSMISSSLPDEATSSVNTSTDICTSSRKRWSAPHGYRYSPMRPSCRARALSLIRASQGIPPISMPRARGLKSSRSFSFIITSNTGLYFEQTDCDTKYKNQTKAASASSQQIFPAKYRQAFT